jgi:hypothetical protein
MGKWLAQPPVPCWRWRRGVGALFVYEMEAVKGVPLRQPDHIRH